MKRKILKRGLCALLTGTLAVSMLFPSKILAGDNQSSSYLPVRGVDISSVIAFENAGTDFYYQNGVRGDIFDILSDAGVNYVRVRVWNNPYDTGTGIGYGGGNNDIWKAIEIGKRATEKGMKVFVDFQYSDFWADPAKQYAPKEWQNYSADQKASAIYNFTYASLKQLIDAGVDVGMVQVGNETNGALCGMGGLYDNVWNLTTGVGEGLKNGCNAVRDINSYYGYTGDDAILRVLHFTDPTTTAEWYAQQVENVGVEYDVFSVSAYPFWFGHASDLSTVLKRIASDYGKKVMVAETAYPYTFDNADSTGNNIGSQADMTYCDYDVSVEGQKQAVEGIFGAVASVNESNVTAGYGLGGFYWEPTWIGASESTSDTYGTGWCSSVSEYYERIYSSTNSEYSFSPQGSSWDNMAMFDENGVALPSLQVFSEYMN